MNLFTRYLIAALLLTTTAIAQQPYQPKFSGDPARSDKEAAALGYMRVVVNAEKLYKQKHGSCAGSLSLLVGQGSFTRRMLATKRGDYTVTFKPKGDGYALWLTPDQPQPELRAFYVDERNNIRADATKLAGPDSPPASAKD